MTHDTIGERIAANRRYHGLTQSELAAHLGRSTRTISAWECGDSQPRADHIVAMCELFGVSAAELLTGGEAA